MPLSLRSAETLAMTYIESGIIPLLVSAPGSGKTTMAKNIAEKLGAKLVPLRLNNLPPEEALGLQFIDDKNKRTIRYAPNWLPASDGSDGPVLVFLDELMQAPDEYRKGIMSALLERYIGDHTIPDNCYFMAAGNSSEDGSNVFDMDTATAARFGIMRIQSNVEEWIEDYAEKEGIELSMIAYLRMRPDHLDVATTMSENDSANIDGVIIPSPRSWSEGSKFLQKAISKKLPENIIKAGLMGKLGEITTEAYWMVHGTMSEMPSLNDMLQMNSKERSQNIIKTSEVLWGYGQAMIWSTDSEDRVAEMLNLLDDMRATDAVQFVEIRTHIVESILIRTSKNGLKISKNEDVKDLLRKWEKEIKPEDNETIEMKEAA